MEQRLGAFALQPANPTTTAGGGETFFVNSWSGTGQQLLLWKLTGDRAAPTLTRATMATTWDYDAIGNNVDQPGSATDIDGGRAGDERRLPPAPRLHHSDRPR